MLARPTAAKKFMQGCETAKCEFTQPSAHPGAVRDVVTVKSLPVHSAEMGERGWEASSPLQHCAAPERVTTRRHLHYSAGGGAEDILHVARGEGVNGLGGSELEEGGTDAFYVVGEAMFTATDTTLLLTRLLQLKHKRFHFTPFQLPVSK